MKPREKLGTNDHPSSKQNGSDHGAKRCLSCVGHSLNEGNQHMHGGEIEIVALLWWHSGMDWPDFDKHVELHIGFCSPSIPISDFASKPWSHFRLSPSWSYGFNPDGCSLMTVYQRAKAISPLCHHILADWEFGLDYSCHSIISSAVSPERIERGTPIAVDDRGPELRMNDARHATSHSIICFGQSVRRCIRRSINTSWQYFDLVITHRELYE